MTPERSLPFQQSPPRRTAATTHRLAWLVVAVGTVCFLLLCALSAYGLWRFRAYTMVPQEDNTLEVYSAPVSLIHTGEVQPIAVPQGRAVSLQEGETVRVGHNTSPGAAALVTLWDDSTLQLYAGTEIVLHTLRATGYSSRRQEVVLNMPAGQVLLGVARIAQYQQVEFIVRTPQGEVRLDPDGTYLLEVGEAVEVAVRHGRAHITPNPGEPALIIEGEKKAIVQAGSVVVGPAQWELLVNGDFVQGLEAWTFRSARNGNTVPAGHRLEQHILDGKSVAAVGLERWGGEQDQHMATAILSQEVEENIAPYRSVLLAFDLKINYQSLPGSGPLGTHYPFAVRIRYQDTEGKGREFLHGFYYRPDPDAEVDLPAGVMATYFPHYRWQHVTLELLELEPTPVRLNGIDLIASGRDYLSWVTNISLTAQFAD